jgi:hypothetical protein
MKQVSLIGIGLLLMISACQKNIADLPTETIVKPSTDTFVTYTILQGLHYSDQAPNVAVNYTEQKFQVLFDSSAIYTTIDPANQADINKLFGFADNNRLHFEFSARFGWRWNNNRLELLAYVYNNGIQTNKLLGAVSLGTLHNCGIKVAGDKYIFTLNGTTIIMDRASITPKGAGYKLYPFFGGDEPAPHKVVIKIKELN